MRPRTDDEILEDLKDWPVRNIYVERGVKLIETLRQRVQELEQQLTEVRRAERERVAEFILRTDLGGIPKNWQGFAADGLFRFAEAIRAME